MSHKNLHLAQHCAILIPEIVSAVATTSVEWPINDSIECGKGIKEQSPKNISLFFQRVILMKWKQGCIKFPLTWFPSPPPYFPTWFPSLTCLQRGVPGNIFENGLLYRAFLGHFWVFWPMARWVHTLSDPAPEPPLKFWFEYSFFKNKGKR